jgi:hypothetical protein
MEYHRFIEKHTGFVKNILNNIYMSNNNRINQSYRDKKGDSSDDENMSASTYSSAAEFDEIFANNPDDVESDLDKLLGELKMTNDPNKSKDPNNLRRPTPNSAVNVPFRVGSEETISTGDSITHEFSMRNSPSGTMQTRPDFRPYSSQDNSPGYTSNISNDGPSNFGTGNLSRKRGLKLERPKAVYSGTSGTSGDEGPFDSVKRSRVNNTRDDIIDGLFSTIEESLRLNYAYLYHNHRELLNNLERALENFILRSPSSQYTARAQTILDKYFNIKDKEPVIEIGYEEHDSQLLIYTIQNSIEQLLITPTILTSTNRGGKQKTTKKKKGKCVKQGTKKYLTRKSPPYPASQCKNKTKRGNDGKMYFSYKASGQKLYKWLPLKSKAAKTKKALKNKAKKSNKTKK